MLIYPTSRFRKTVTGLGARKLTDSDLIVAQFLSQGPWGSKPVGNEFTPDDWGRPAYFANTNDPAYTITQGLRDPRGWADPVPKGHVFHAPPGARPAGGDDAGAVFFNPDGFCYSMWQSADPVDGRCQMAGMIPWTTDGMPRDGYRGIGQAWFGPRMGQVTYEELVVNKEIPHALFMEVHNWRGRAWGKGDDGQDSKRGGYTTNPEAPRMGDHFCLTYSFPEIDALDVPDWKKVILRAMHRYGLYVYDNGGSAHSLDWESAIPALVAGRPNPWVEFAKANPSSHITGGPGVYYFNIEKGVDWKRLKVLTRPFRYGSATQTKGARR